MSKAWKNLTTATAPILKWETASYSPNFNLSILPPYSKSHFDSVSCHEGTSAASPPHLVKHSGFSLAITMPDILEKSYPCSHGVYAVYILGFHMETQPLCDKQPVFCYLLPSCSGKISQFQVEAYNWVEVAWNKTLRLYLKGKIKKNKIYITKFKEEHKKYCKP